MKNPHTNSRTIRMTTAPKLFKRAVNWSSYRVRSKGVQIVKKTIYTAFLWWRIKTVKIKSYDRHKYYRHFHHGRHKIEKKAWWNILIEEIKICLKNV